MKLDLTDKVIVITGASSGIGRQCAIQCSKHGAKLALFGRDSAALAETLNLTSNFNDSFCYPLDFFEETDFDLIANLIVSKLGPVSGAIHSAGMPSTIAFRALNQQSIEGLLKVNVSAPLLFTRSLIKSSNISSGGASIVFISSVMGVVGEIGKTLYGLTKGALISSSKSLAIELAPKKIRVNCVSPGVVRSPMSMQSVYSKDIDSMRKIEKLHPLGFGDVEDVANVCHFLLADESKWITGTNVIVDGGYTAR